MKKRNSIIAAVNKRTLKRTHKFGIRLPKNVDDAKRVDELNGNRMWQDAIEKEINTVRKAFRILDNDESVPPGHQQIRCHMIFDVKIEDFKCKCRLVAKGNMTETPATMTYASLE